MAVIQARPLLSSRGLVVAIACILLAVPVGLAADGEGLGLRPVARVAHGMPRAIASVGDTVFTALDSGLMVLDASAGTPRVVSHLPLPAAALAIAADDAVVVVACGETGAIVLDATDPRAPREIARVAAEGRVVGAAARGGLVFLVDAAADSQVGGVLRVVGGPGSRVLGRIALATTPRCIVAREGGVLIGGSGPGAAGRLLVVDTSDPGAPILAGELVTSRPVLGIEPAGAHAWLAMGLPLAGALARVDLTDEAAPRLVSSLAVADAVTSVVESGSGVVAAAGAAGLLRVVEAAEGRLVVLDAVRLASLPVAVTATSSGLVAGTRSSSGAGGLLAIEAPASAPMALREEGISMAEATGVARADSGVLALSRDGLALLDDAQPALPRVLSRWNPPGADLSSVAASGTRAAVAWGSSVALLDAADPTRIEQVGQAFLEDGAAVGLALASEVLLAANGRTIEIFDLRDIAAPRRAATFSPSTWSVAVAARGSLAASAGGSLDLFDVRDPAHPVALSSLPIGGAHAVEIGEGMAVVAGASADLIVVDIADPLRPRVLARVGEGPALGVALDGTTCVVALGERGVQLYDLADPARPRRVASFDTSGVARAVTVAGPVVHVAAEAAQHWVFLRDQRLEFTPGLLKPVAGPASAPGLPSPRRRSSR